MTNRIRIKAVATNETRLLVMRAHGSDAATVALFTAALAFMSDQPGDRGSPIALPPTPTLALPKKPRRRRP